MHECMKEEGLRTLTKGLRLDQGEIGVGEEI